MTTSPDRDADLILSGAFAPEEGQIFRHVPFTVPEAVDQLHLRIAYNDRIDASPFRFGGNTLDIGLFDERGTTAGGAGFHGWSGSNKLEVTVGREWATPPYRAGPPGAGVWHLLLSGYKVGPNGLDYRVEVWFNSDLPAPPVRSIPDQAPRRDPLPPAVEPGWYRGDLHLHTVYSDGNAHPAGVAAAAAEAGLDFIGITDHNRAQSPDGLVPEGEGWPVLVPGIEVTTYAGHFNVWGVDGWFEFRDPSAEGLRAAIEAAIAAGGLVSINHPKPFGPPWEYPDLAAAGHAVEVWNGWWSRINHVSLRFWDERLRRGERLVALGGSDLHTLGLFGAPDDPFAPAKIGHPTLWVEVPDGLSRAGILAAARAGRCFLSESPNGPQLYLSRREDGLRTRVVGAAGDAMVFVGATGVVHATAISGADETIELPLGAFSPETKYIRAEIHCAGGGIRGLSNVEWLAD